MEVWIIYFFKILSFKFIWVFKNMQHWALCTLLYHYTNFYNFWTTFATSIEWKKKSTEKIYEKVPSISFCDALTCGHAHGCEYFRYLPPKTDLATPRQIWAQLWKIWTATLQCDTLYKSSTTIVSLLDRIRHG